ncbi:hypothetical protein KV395_11560 [Microbacterium luteolum]|uniref:Uncharacterized protein n=1 Tax=Microbacterium luteolum TaxID=69367 RepID=A0ABY7XP10_MICLT|nr:hypothetical protein [Microbacterium luteolum]WDM43840.1 hypothetical protein KV395_11560 [Microbacterium luteolum]
MRTRAPRLLLLSTLAVFAVVATGCTPTAPQPSGSPGSAVPSPSASATSSAANALVTIDGLSIDDGPLIEYTDHEAVLAALGDIVGPVPAAQGPDQYGFTSYDWDGAVRLNVPESGRAGLWVGSADTPGVVFTVADDIGIGATREAALAAGAEELPLDDDGDGVNDYLAVGTREVPGTTSLVRPGEVGIEYVMLALDGDTVSKIFGLANDFSDL